MGHVHDHFGEINCHWHPFCGSVAATLFRNPLSVTVIGTIAVVSAIGNRITSKFVENLVGTVVKSVETPSEVGTFVGAP